MPTATFFRLPEEKRKRLMTEAWNEFTHVPFAEASINRIVLKARIPRGSFYQYFEDKNDLFLYLIDCIRDKFMGLLDKALKEAEGDVFKLPALLLDMLISPDDAAAPGVSKEFALLGLNASMDVRHIFFDRAAPELCPKALLERIEATYLRSQEPLFVECTFSLLVSALADAIAQVLSGRGTREEEHEKLNVRVEIIKLGSGAKGEEK